MKKIIWGIVVILIIVWGVNAFVRNKNKITPVKIGFVGSLTGGLQSWGLESKNSIALAVKEINSVGGINGQPLEVIYEDGKCEGPASTSAVNKLITVDKVKTIIAYCSLEVLTAAPIAEKNQVLLFAPAATNPDITNVGDYVFRLAPSDMAPARELAMILATHSRIAIITEASDFSIGFRKYVLENLSDKTKIVFDENFVSGTRDFKTLVTKIKQNNPDVIVVNANTPAGEGLIIKQLKQMGLNVPRYGIYWGSDPEFIKTAGTSAEGFTYFNFTAEVADPRTKEFIGKYKIEYGELPPNPQFAILSYEGARILGQALREVGNNSKKIKDYLLDLKDYDSLLGKVSFDSNGDATGAGFKIFTIKDGKSVYYQVR